MCRVVCLLAFLGYLHAQQSITSATLSGTVVDPAGAAVAGAAVRMRHEGTGMERSSVADAHGRFRFDVLPAGTYELRAEKPRFATSARRVTLSMGQALDLPLALDI